MSPDCNKTMSPGTNSVEEIRRISPARKTLASVNVVWASAASAFAALDSCRNPMMALTRTTPKITLESTHSFKTAVIAAAASKMYTSGVWNCSRNRTHAPCPRAAGITLGPNCACRARSSKMSSPFSASVPNSRSTSSAGSRCKFSPMGTSIA